MIKIVKDNIVNMDVEAIVNAANSSLMGGGGVDGAIHIAAGPKLDEACAKIGHCYTGQAVITPGFNLKAKYIIHTVGPIYFNFNKDESARLLRDCYINSLKLAIQNNIHSIAFPCISCGVYGYPIDEAAPIAIKTCKDFLKDNPNMDIWLVAYTNGEYEIYQKCDQ